jgi:hypothetical protein
MEPTDKAILGMVSESPGRNASEPTGGLEKDWLRRPSPPPSGEGSMAGRGLLTTGALSFLMESAYRGHIRLETPDLRVTYTAPAQSFYAHGRGS